MPYHQKFIVPAGQNAKAVKVAQVPKATSSYTKVVNTSKGTPYSENISKIG